MVRKNMKSLLNLAVPYLIVIFLPLLSVLCLGGVILNNYQEQIIRDKQKNIEIAFERFLQRIDAVENLAYMIAQSDVMEQYMYDSLSNRRHTVLDCMEMKNQLSNSWSNSDVTELYFYDVDNQSIITSHSVLSEAEGYFRFFYQIDGLTAGESADRVAGFRKGMGYNTAINVIIEGKKASVLEYHISLPVNMAINDVQGQLVLVMKRDKIFSDFYDVMQEQGEFYVYDSKDNLIFGSGNIYENLLDLQTATALQRTDVSGKSVYSMVCRSDDSEWKVKMYLPELEKMGIVENLMPYALLFVVLPIMVSVLLCTYFTFRKHKDIYEIWRLFKGEEESDLEKTQEEVSYKLIKEYANRLVNENVTFRKQIVDYERSRKQEILEKVIRNTYEDSSEMKKALETVNLQMKEGKCVVLCLRYLGTSYRTWVSETMTIRELVKGMLSSLLEQQFEIVDTSARETVCILFIGDVENPEAAMRDILSGLKVEITYNWGIEVEIAAGGWVESLEHAGESYKQAKEVIRYNETSEKEIYLYADLKNLENMYYYPKNLDEKIYNYVALGMAKEAKETIRRIYQENFGNREVALSAKASEMIKDRLRDSLMSMAPKCSVSLENTADELNAERDIQRYFERIYACIDWIAGEIKNKKVLQQNQSALKIIRFVNQNYCDNTLSLKLISREFGFNETYVSSLFRKTYGENFSSVIEKLRIKKACELIRNTDMKISDVAGAVGYASDASFRRAFKKVKGATPGEYREE